MSFDFLHVSAWLVAAIWLAAWLWTFYCLKNQKPLSTSEKSDKAPFVSILVPARNEAGRVLEKSISSILRQTYKNYEVIVLDDRSTDSTREILLKIQSEISNLRFEIVDGAELPQNWLGKPHALHQALEKARGEWILTTDADIIFAPRTLETVINYAEKSNFDALTLIPKQIFGSFWETLFMPVFAWFCLLAMPLHRVNNPKRSDSMGVGNFFMLRREVLDKVGGFESIKAEVAEDLRLAEIIKKAGFHLRIDYAPALLETQMYAGFSEIWKGFTKNLFSGMKFSPSKTIFGVISIFLLGVLPFFVGVTALLFGQFYLSVPLFLAYLGQAGVFAFVHRQLQGNILYALLAPVGFLMFLAILINSAVKILSGKGVTWKDRAIYEKGGVRPPAN